MARRIKENPSAEESDRRYNAHMAFEAGASNEPVIDDYRPLEEFEVVGRCSVCKEKQYATPSGNTCKNGHGGEDTRLGRLRSRAGDGPRRRAVAVAVRDGMG